MALGVAIAFVVLPFGSGLVTRFRLSQISIRHMAAPEHFPHGEPALTTARVDSTPQGDVSLAIRPRAVRFMLRGYVYCVGVGAATAFAFWLLSIGLGGIAAPTSRHKAEGLFIVLMCSVCLWACITFYRNRLRERRLFMKGELSQGFIVTQYSTQLGSHIVYGYRDGSGNTLQNRATDFSKKLYEEMPIHVFYNPLDSRESAALEGSLFQLPLNS